jgi:hypothetical protein
VQAQGNNPVNSKASPTGVFQEPCTSGFKGSLLSLDGNLGRNAGVTPWQFQFADEIELVGRGASIAPGSGFSRNPVKSRRPHEILSSHFRNRRQKVIATLSVFRSSQT